MNHAASSCRRRHPPRSRRSCGAVAGRFSTRGRRSRLLRLQLDVRVGGLLGRCCGVQRTVLRQGRGSRVAGAGMRSRWRVAGRRSRVADPASGAAAGAFEQISLPAPGHRLVGHRSSPSRPQGLRHFRQARRSRGGAAARQPSAPPRPDRPRRGVRTRPQPCLIAACAAAGRAVSRQDCGWGACLRGCCGAGRSSTRFSVPGCFLRFRPWRALRLSAATQLAIGNAAKTQPGGPPIHVTPLWDPARRSWSTQPAIGGSDGLYPARTYDIKLLILIFSVGSTS
jgi:hypothetical protein